MARPARRWPGELRSVEGDRGVRVELRPAPPEAALAEREAPAVEGVAELAVAVEREQRRRQQGGEGERGSPPDAERSGDHQAGEGQRERPHEAA